jgi:hypothetical protein
MPIFKINQDKAEQLSMMRDGFGNEAELRDWLLPMLMNGQATVK